MSAKREGDVMTCTRRIVGLAAALVLLAASPPRQSDSPDLQAEARRIESLLITPCCWRQPVSVHPSEEANRMKAEIRQMLEEGKTEQEILDHYVAIYGPRILSIPPQQGFGRTALLMPLLFSLAGVAVVGGLLLRWKQARLTEASTPTDPREPLQDSGLDAETSRRIQEELESLDGD